MRKKATSIKKKLGDLLVDSGIITKSQLEQAIDIQKRSGEKLGGILMQLGFISEEILLAFLGKQYGVSYIALPEFGDIPPEVIRLVPESVVRHQNLIPISCENEVITIAMADPLNVFATDDLKLMTGKDIQVVIAAESDVKNAIERYYPKAQEEAQSTNTMDETVEELEGKGAESNLEVLKDSDDIDTYTLGMQAKQAPVIKIVNLLLSNAIMARASDIHIEPFEKTLRIRYRIDGVLHNHPSPPKSLQNAIVSRIKVMSNLDISERRQPQDGRIKIKISTKDVDLRVSTLPTSFGEKVVMRILDQSALRLDLTKLGFEPETLATYKKHIHSPYGIILVTGPTGSGKTTTLYSTLHTLNHPDCNIMTIEDPVEYLIDGINQVQFRPEVGLTFASGLRSFLRQDPDIIMVGEIRDKETAEIAINAALTGHLVFSTLHTNDAASTLTRLTNMNIEPYLITSTLLMVVAQRLIRVLCQNCKEPYEVSYEDLTAIGLPYDKKEKKSTKGITLYRAKGCEKCAGTGYKGRLSCYEVMEINDEIRGLILQRSSSNILKVVSRKNGMMTLREAALRKLLGGLTTVEEVIRVTSADTTELTT